MAYSANGNYVPDAAAKNRAAYLEDNPVWYSETVINTIGEDAVIEGNERLRYE